MVTTTEDNRLLAVVGAVVLTLLGAGLVCFLLVWHFSTQARSAAPIGNAPAKGNRSADAERAAADAADDQLAGESVTKGRPPLVPMPALGGFELDDEPDLAAQEEPLDDASTLSVRPYRSDEIEIPPYDPPLVPGAELELPEETPVVAP